MNKMNNLIQQNEITAYLFLVFLISLSGFVFMYIVPAWQTPENPSALPVWLLAVWSPTISALIMWWIQGRLASQIVLALSLPPASFWFLLLIIPLAILLFVIGFHSIDAQIDLSKAGPGLIALLFLMNLVLGPLGEEAGWRGFLLEAIVKKTGWLGASLIIGAIWTIWHAPLWSIKSPQADINFFVFCGHVFCYSVIMTILALESKGSLIPVIGFHLLVNVVSGYVVILGTHSTSEFYEISLYYYSGFTFVVVGLYHFFRSHA